MGSADTMRYPRNYFPVKRCFYKRLHLGPGQPPAVAAPHPTGGRKGNGPDWDSARRQHKKET